MRALNHGSGQRGSRPCRSESFWISWRVRLFEHGLERFAMQGAVGAVEALESLEQQEQPLEVPALELVVLPVDRMGDAVGDAIALDVLGDVVNVRRKLLQRVVILGGDAVDQHVHLAVVLGKPAGQLLADEHILARRDARHAFDRVVVGDGDEVHPAALCLGVNFLGIAVAFRAADRVERGLGGLVAGVAVAMQIDPPGRGGCVKAGGGVRNGHLLEAAIVTR